MSTKLSNLQTNQIITYLILALLVGLGLWLRLRFIHTVHLYPDEFVTLLAVRMIGEKGTPVMPSGLFYEHGLLFSYVGSLAALFGPVGLAVRYASLLFGLLTLCLTYWLGQRWFSPAVGLMATTGLAITPTAIHWSGRARMYALLQLLVLLTLWLAYEGVVRQNARWRWAALAAYLGATLTHFLAVALAPPLVVAAGTLWWLQAGAEDQTSDSRDRKSLLSWRALVSWLKEQRVLWLELLAFSGILFTAFLVKRAGQPKGIEVLEVTNALSGVGQVLAIYSNISPDLIGGWQAIAPFFLALPALILTPFAAVLISVSLGAVGLIAWRLWRNSSSQSAALPSLHFPTLFLSFILILTTFEMIFLVSPDRRDDKYLFMLLPVLFWLGAQGMFVISRQLSVISCQLLASRYSSKNHNPIVITPALRAGASAHKLQLTILVFITGLIIFSTWPRVEALLANTGDDYDSAFAYVQKHWQPGDTILTGTPAAAAFYLGRNDFYGVQRQGGYDYRLLTIEGQDVDRWLASPAIRTETALHQTLADHKVWLVLERWGLQREYYDLPFQQQLLAQTEHVGDSQGIFILRSKPRPRPLALDPIHSVEAVFGDLVRLTGYTIEPNTSQPGQSPRLTLYWQSLTPMTHDYTVFVHLRRPEGGNVAQADHRPLGSLYPTTLWPVGETIREMNEDLSIPADLPPGEYELWVGLYLLETGERLPVQNDTSGENAVKLGTLTVEK